MALIKCPECGKEISDKADVCVSCGFPIHTYTPPKRVCGLCGFENEADAEHCRQCGMKMQRFSGHTNSVQTQQVESDKTVQSWKIVAIFCCWLFSPVIGAGLMGAWEWPRDKTARSILILLSVIIFICFRIAAK